ncbi:MAG TPA: hypothetical protein VF525_15290 [Pyrinomonadaceae bacterium]|jgi:hypothetical protein
MKVYEDCAQVQGFNTEARLELEDDGRFRYSETWADYTNVSLGLTVEGSWRREGDAIILHPRSVAGDICRWAVGQERKGVERGDILDFGQGFTLRITPERKEDVFIGNTGRTPQTVVLEASGPRHVVEPKLIAPPPRIAASSPPVAPRAPLPLPVTRYPRFKLPTPAPELAALIRHWLEELPAQGRPGWLVSLCKEHDAIPLHSTQFDLWVLRPDGYVLRIEHDSVARWAEPETDPVTAYAVVAQSTRTYPELGALLSTAPEGFRQCELCGGVGWQEAAPPALGTKACARCAGFG